MRCPCGGIFNALVQSERSGHQARRYACMLCYTRDGMVPLVVAAALRLGGLRAVVLMADEFPTNARGASILIQRRREHGKETEWPDEF